MILKAVIFKNRETSGGEYSIFIRITENRKSRYVPVGIRTILKNWDEKAGACIGSHKHLNKLIDQAKETINTPLEKNKLTFYQYADKWIEKFNHEKTLRRYNRFRSQLKALKAWHPADPSFKEVDRFFVRDYQSFMSKTKAINTVDLDIRALKSIVYAAIEDEFIKLGDNPFFNFKSKTEASHKEKLNAEELALFRKYEPKTENEGHAKNVFLLSFNCKGIRFSDICKMTWGNVNNGTLTYVMGKTGKRKVIALNKESILILDKYDKSTPYIFPFLGIGKQAEYKQIDSANAKINKALKAVGKGSEIKKPISTHIARHTWAQMAKIAMKKHPDKITLFDIQKGLEHHSISMTERYMEDLDDDPLDDINKLIVGE